jgi:hypothetical protein
MMTRSWLAGIAMLLIAIGFSNAQDVTNPAKVRITPQVYLRAGNNHGQLHAAWENDSGLTTSTSQAHKGLVLHKGTESADLGIPYANVEGFEGASLHQLGFDVRSQRKKKFSGEHCNASPTIEVTLTNGTTYAFYCTAGKHTPLPNTAWDRIRFTDADAKPISCGGKGCEMQPWPGFASGKAVIATPKDQDPKSSTFQIIMMDGYDSGPDYSGVTYIDNIDLNGTVIGDGAQHAVKCKVRGCTPQSPDIEARGEPHAHS